MAVIGRLSGRTIFVACLFYLILPVVVVIVFSFQDASRTGLPFEGPSLRWFELILKDSAFRSALTATLLVAATSAITSSVIAFLGALAASRGKLPYPGFLRGAGLLPLIVPPVFIGFALLLTFGEIGLTPSLFTVYLAHVLVTVPLAWAVMLARFSGFDFSVEEAARDLGAGRLKVLSRVTLPLTWRSIMGATLISFAFSVDEFVVTNFVVGADNTLPVMIFSRLRRSIDPSINAIATLLLLTAVLAGIIAWLLLRNDPGKGAADPDIEVPAIAGIAHTAPGKEQR
ncbi:MAG: ABC transporter permease [Thermoleophilia bacterium]|nr:ABC transporter permease [Thermoleophilia bacterium]